MFNEFALVDLVNGRKSGTRDNIRRGGGGQEKKYSVALGPITNPNLHPPRVYRPTSIDGHWRTTALVVARNDQTTRRAGQHSATFLRAEGEHM